MNKRYLSVLVDNHAGVLARVSSLFCQRGFNIDSLTVSATNDPTVSRITIACQGDETTYDQILKQTRKLVETRAILSLDSSVSLLRELLLLKVACDEPTRGALRDVAAIYTAKIIDLSPGSMVMELTGEPDKIDNFFKLIAADHEILEMCRTGVTALERGPVRYKLD